MEDFHRQCKLCGNNISDENFEEIDAGVKNFFGVLSLKLTFDDKVHHVMCKVCSTKLTEAFDFKAKCLYTDDIIVPYVDLENLKPLDLKEIYDKVKECKNENSILNNLEVCRLCFQPITTNHISIREVPSDSIQIYIPEINFAMTTNPAICIKCLYSLLAHSSFVRCCSDMEEKNYSSKTKVEDAPLITSCIKTEEFEIKCETDEEDIQYNDIEKYATLEGKTSVHSLNNFTSMEEIKRECDLELQIDNCESNTDQEDQFAYENSEIPLYTCDVCEYNTVRKSNLRIHMLRHKDLSEVKTYKCSECDYKSFRKEHIKQHQWKHQDPSEVRMYRCNECDYKSVFTSNVKKHQLTHKPSSEGKIYKCEKCDYNSNSKSNLARHQLIHEDPSQVQMYHCDECDFKSKLKNNLKIHQLRHKDPSEMTMYKCDECDYKSIHRRITKRHQLIHKERILTCDECDYSTNYKVRLKQHQLKHKDPSEVQMYRCDRCDYKGIDKYNLKRHQMKHKDPSEVQMYSCGLCDYKSFRKSTVKSHRLTHKDTFEEQTYKKLLV